MVKFIVSKLNAKIFEPLYFQGPESLKAIKLVSLGISFKQLVIMEHLLLFQIRIYVFYFYTLVWISPRNSDTKASPQFSEPFRNYGLFQNVIYLLL